MNRAAYMRGARAYLSAVPLGWWIIAALVVAVGFQSWRVHSWQNTAAENALALSNQKARTDTTRTSPLSKKDAAKLLGDTFAAVEHLAVQTPGGITRDAFDKALNRQTATIANLTAQVKALTSRSTGTVVGDTGVRTATFDVRKEPYTAHAVATVPAAPAIGSLDLSVSIDPAHFALRTQCGKEERGIRPAITMLTGPKWLPVIVDSTEVSSDVCHSPALTKQGRRLHLAAFGGYGVTAGPNSTVTRGPVIGIGAAYVIW